MANIKTSKKIIIFCLIVTLATVTYYSVTTIHKSETNSLKTASKSNEFAAKVLIVDKDFLDRWYSTKTKEAQYATYSKTVKGGQMLFFPIVYSHFSVDQNGNGLVSATVTVIKPNGETISSRAFANIAQGMNEEQTNLIVLQRGGVLGDNFISTNNPEKYPLGVYTVKAIVTDKISGKTIEDAAHIEKIQ